MITCADMAHLCGGDVGPCGGELCSDDGFDIVDADQDVLWLEIGMDHAAIPMQIVEAE